MRPFAFALVFVLLSAFQVQAAEAPADVLATVPGDALVVVHASNLARVCENAEAFAGALVPMGPPPSLLSALTGKFGNPERAGLKSDGAAVLFLTSIPDFQGNPCALIMEVDDYEAFRDGSGALAVTRSPAGFDLVSPDPTTPGGGFVMTPLAGGRVLVAFHDRVVLHFQDAQGPPISQTLPKEALAGLRGGDLAVAVQVGKLRQAYAQQIAGFRMMIGQAMAMQAGSATPGQAAMMNAYQNCLFGALDQVRTFTQSVSLDATGLELSAQCYAEPDSKFAAFLASQDVGVIPGESAVTDDALLSLAWNADFGSLKEPLAGFVTLLLEATDPEPAPPGEDAPAGAAEDYQRALAERVEHHEAMLDYMERTMDLTRGDGVCLFHLTEDGEIALVEAIGATDSAALKEEYDVFMAGNMEMMMKMTPGVEVEYDVDAREFLGQPASVMRMKMTGEVPPGSPFMGPGGVPPFMQGNDWVIFPKGDYVVIAMNAGEGKVREVLAAAESGQVSEGQTSVLLATLPEKRNFLVAGSYARLLMSIFGMPVQAAPTPAPPGFAMSVSFEPDVLGVHLTCSIEEIIGFRNFGMAMAAQAMGQGGMPVQPMDDEGME